VFKKHYNSATNCLIALKFGVWVHYGSVEFADMLRVCRLVHYGSHN